MAGLPRAIIKKYGVSKKAWAVFRGSRSSPRRVKKSNGGYMAKKYKGRKKSGGMRGIMSYAKPVIFSAVAGTAGGIIASKIPIVQNMPNPRAIVGGAAGMAAGYMSKKRWEGAAVGLAVGAISGQFAAPPVGEALNQATGMRIY